ncbi:MAG: HupE/UreJ family protein [Pseudomonadales bacterium]|nr:HupE/UreJ family protein [Pseudomonadales bacterium]
MISTNKRMSRSNSLFVVWILIVGLGASALAPSVYAHEVRPAYLQLTEVELAQDTTGYHILWKQPIVQDRRLPIDPVFPENCEVTDLAPPEVAAAALLYHWQTACDLSQASIHINGLTVTLTDVLVRLDRLNGESANYILRPESPTLNLAEAEAPALSYLTIGVEHLVFGIDHVLFVIGLFLFIRAPIPLLKTITAFTVAHSITLALSVLELVRLEQGPVEAIIALSILFLARELVQGRDQRSALTLGRPWVMAFIFGLLHGLGFAGALADIGLPEDDLWLSLLLFNVGIEVGQLMVIAILAIAVWLLRQIKFDRQFSYAAAWGMGCVAAYWTIDRTLLLI